jgi:hypothetical protein
MNSMNVTFSTNTASNGMMAKFNVFLTLGESRAVEEINSFDDSRSINTTATRAPPTPRPIAADMVIADEAAVVDAADDTMLDSISYRNPFVV